VRHRPLAGILGRIGGTSGDSRTFKNGRSLLVATELAGAFTLLIGTGLMVRTVINLAHANLGYDIDGIVRARLVLPPRAFSDANSMSTFYDRFVTKLSTTPDTTAAVANWPSFAEPPQQSIETDNGPLNRGISVVAVSGGYFQTLGIRLKQGRDFTAADRLGTEPVAVVSETVAKRLWPDRNPLGQRVRTPDQPGFAAPLAAWRTVVGVVADIRWTYADDDLRDIYIPFLQAPARFATLYLRTTRPASSWLNQLRATAAEVNPETMVAGVQSLLSQDQQLTSSRFLASMLTSFATLTVFIVVIGVFSVFAFAAKQREKELAIRIALGADAAQITRMFLLEGSFILSGGVVAGILGAVATARALGNRLYGVQPFDISTIGIAGTILVLSALLAMLLPVIRAAKADPLVALKEN
jgi:putative ABC transport system permease protein